MGSTVKPTYLRMFFEKKYKQSNISRWKDIDIIGDFFHDEVAEWLRRWTNVNGFFPEIMFTVFLTTFLYTAGKCMLQESRYRVHVITV
jgi:hypothetical protein